MVDPNFFASAPDVSTDYDFSAPDFTPVQLDPSIPVPTDGDFAPNDIDPDVIIEAYGGHSMAVAMASAPLIQDGDTCPDALEATYTKNPPVKTKDKIAKTIIVDNKFFYCTSHMWHLSEWLRNTYYYRPVRVMQTSTPGYLTNALQFANQFVRKDVFMAYDWEVLNGQQTDMNAATTVYTISAKFRFQGAMVQRCTVQTHANIQSVDSDWGLTFNDYKIDALCRPGPDNLMFANVDFAMGGAQVLAAGPISSEERVKLKFVREPRTDGDADWQLFSGDITQFELNASYSLTGQQDGVEKSFDTQSASVADGIAAKDTDFQDLFRIVGELGDSVQTYAQGMVSEKAPRLDDLQTFLNVKIVNQLNQLAGP
jgi:hypothetical protein